MTMLEMRMNTSSQVQPSSNPTDQSSHSSSPTHFNSPSTGEEMIIVLAVLMGVIYGFKVLGRIRKREE